MVKLETLKDIVYCKFDKIDNEYKKIAIEVEEGIKNNIKNNGIHWIKSLRKRLDEKDVTSRIRKIVLGQIEILYLINDITEDELK
jgi:hypothetical protein